MPYYLKTPTETIECEEIPVKENNNLSGVGLLKQEQYDFLTNKITISSIKSRFFLKEISDFSLYSLVDEQGDPVEFATPPVTDDDLLTQLAITEVYEEQIYQKEELLTTQLAVAEIFEIII